jgi:ankyrin repeat protein
MCELATDGNIAAIKLLVKHRVDVNAPNRNGRLAIQEAAIRNNRELVMLLFDHGSRLDWRDPHYGGSAVGWATAGGNIELREELLDRSRDVFDLTRFGRLEQLKRLLEESPETAQKSTRHGNTPLHLVCGRTPHAQQIIDLLLSKGADPNAKNDDGQTPLAVQEEPDDDAIVELLKARGAREG